MVEEALAGDYASPLYEAVLGHHSMVHVNKAAHSSQSAYSMGCAMPSGDSCIRLPFSSPRLCAQMQVGVGSAFLSCNFDDTCA
jgi:hypothetical protein